MQIYRPGQSRLSRLAAGKQEDLEPKNSPADTSGRSSHSSSSAPSPTSLDEETFKELSTSTEESIKTIETISSRSTGSDKTTNSRSTGSDKSTGSRSTVSEKSYGRRSKEDQTSTCSSSVKSVKQPSRVYSASRPNATRSNPSQVAPKKEEPREQKGKRYSRNRPTPSEKQ